MFFLDLTIIITLLSRISCNNVNSKGVPVIIIDYEHVHSKTYSLSPNPLTFLSEVYFRPVIQNIQQIASAVVIYVEEELIVEDLSVKDNQGTPYRNLQMMLHEKNAVYFPAVVDPFKIVSKVFPPQEFNVVTLRNSSEKLKWYKAYKYLYVYFEDDKNETRSSALRRHDFILHEVHSALRQQVAGPVVAIYMGQRYPDNLHSLTSIPCKPCKPPLLGAKHMGELKFNSDTAHFKFGG